MISNHKANQYIKPRCLKPGDRIAVIAPSSPIDAYQIKAGIDILKENHLEPVLGDNIRFLRSAGLLAAPMKDRLAEFEWAWEDESIAGIIVATGGFGSAELLPELSYEKIAVSPKILMGYSDVTALNNGLLAKAGIISFSGPTLSVRYDTEEHKKVDSLVLSKALKLLMSGEIWRERAFDTPDSFARCVFPGKAMGPAIGGNLTTFECLLGTPYFPDTTDSILFLEDIDEGGYELARSLLHLKLAGVFEKVSAVIFGEFARTPSKVDPGDPDIEEVIVNFFKNGPPCAYGFNFSHSDTGQAVIPIGCMTSVDTEKTIVSFDTPFLYG